MVRRQPDGLEATCDGPEAILMVQRQQVFFVLCYSDGSMANYKSKFIRITLISSHTLIIDGGQ